jgi:hypothetical protein
MLTALATKINDALSPPQAALQAARSRASEEQAAALEAAQAYREALADELEGTTDSATVAAAKKRRDETADRAEASALALTQLQERQAYQKALQAKAADEAQWRRITSLANSRSEEIGALVDAVTGLAIAYTSYLATTRHLLEALPGVPPQDVEHAAYLRAGQIEGAMLQELARLGCNLGVTTSPSILHSAPTLAERLADVATVILQTRKAVP